MAFRIEPLRDHNEITHHCLTVIHLHAPQARHRGLRFGREKNLQNNQIIKIIKYRPAKGPNCISKFAFFLRLISLLLGITQLIMFLWCLSCWMGKKLYVFAQFRRVLMRLIQQNWFHVNIKIQERFSVTPYHLFASVIIITFA